MKIIILGSSSILWKSSWEISECLLGNVESLLKQKKYLSIGRKSPHFLQVVKHTLWTLNVKGEWTSLLPT